MPSRHSESYQEVKPQSIVHHIGRLGSRIAKPICNRRKCLSMNKKGFPEGNEGSHQQSFTMSESDTSSISTISSITYSDASLQKISEDSFGTADDTFSFVSCDDEDSVMGEEEEGLFQTIDQNEFLLECFLTNQHSDVLFLVHFFNPETSISDFVEDILSIRVLETKSRCQCRKLNSKNAPLFTGKLQIDPEQPTILAIQNGKILSKVSMSSSACQEDVDQWLERTRLLHSQRSMDTFLGLSTKI